jgi:hypothetical protein
VRSEKLERLVGRWGENGGGGYGAGSEGLVGRGYGASLQAAGSCYWGDLGRCSRLVWSCAVGAYEGGLLGEGEYGASRARAGTEGRVGALRAQREL